MCACRGCWLLFTPEGAGGGHFKAVPERYAAFPDFALSRRAVGRAADPGRAWRSSSSTPRSGGSPRSIRVRPAPPSRCCRSTPGTSWSPRNAELAALEPDVEAFLVRPSARDGEAECYLVPIDACYELVGELRRLWQRLRRWHARRTHALDAFFDGVAARRRGATDERARLRGRSAPGRSRTPRCRRSCSGCAITERVGRAGARGRVAVPDPDRAAAPPLQPRRGGPPGRDVRRAAAVGPDSLKPFLWTHVATTVTAFDGLHRDRPAGHVHLRLRGRRAQVPPRARRRRDPARRCCSPAPRSRRRRRALGRAGRLARGGVVPPAGRGLARR